MIRLAGIDIGGTKCAVVMGQTTDAGVELLDKVRFPTPATPEEALLECVEQLQGLTEKYGGSVDGIGISCGGPLDSQQGLVLSPPNLPTWDGVDVRTPFAKQFHVPVGLQNDANACALAEWKWGAGRGTRNMLFLTFGTGMGAGLILDGRLYAGTNDMAGEIGHIRLQDTGPLGYGKAGSFEGFCSGGGIARLAKTYAKEALKNGKPAAFCRSETELSGITAERVGRAAEAGDAVALKVWETVAERLGLGLSILVDVLNPECIVIGSIYGRQQALLEPGMMAKLTEEALERSLSVCRVVPAQLGEHVGDYASLSVAMYALEQVHM